MPDVLDRTLPSTRRVLGDVDPAQPLDVTHSLLEEVVGFWLPLPRLVGGSQLYDLGPGSEHGDFVSMQASTWDSDSEFATPFITPTDRQEEIELPTNPLPIGTSARSFFFVFSTTNDKSNTGGPGQLFCPLVSYGEFNTAEAWNIVVEDGRIRLAAQSADTTWGNLDELNDGAVHTCVVTFPENGTVNDLSCYVDGRELSANSSKSTALDTSTAQDDGGPQRLIHVTDGFFDHSFDGRFGPTLALSRQASSREAQFWDDQARRGFPDLLNRRDSVGLLGGGGGPAADTVSFGTGAALADGFAPTITATANTVSPDTGQAAAQGFSATVTGTQNTIAAGTAQATAQGFAPTITTGSNTIAATTGQAAAQGFDPTISEGAAGDTLVADLGTAQAQGFAPSITTNPVTVTLGLGQAPATGFDPDVVADPSEINTGQGQAPATGFDPTITTNARTVVPQLGEAQAQGFEPAVVDGTVGVATTMEIEARPLYEIDVEAKPLYRIRLFVKEQLP